MVPAFDGGDDFVWIGRPNESVVIALLVAYTWFLKMPLDEIIPLVLTAILASIRFLTRPARCSRLDPN